MTSNEQDVSDIMNPIVESVLMRHDAAIDAAESNDNSVVMMLVGFDALRELNFLQ